jgi:arylsulfatase A-like enzyme
LTAVRALLAAVVLWSLSNAADAQERPPNIVFILADDLGWTDLGCYGSRYYETPHIDGLCRQGLTFTCAYTNGPNCAPTRACLMSGQYGPRTGVYTVNTGERGEEQYRKLVPAPNRKELSPGIVTVAEALKVSGYRTGIFGKWHLGDDPEHRPAAQGFDVAVARGEREHPATDFLTDEAIRFIRDSGDRPFFCYLPYHAVHTPIRAPRSLVQKYTDKQPHAGHDDPQYAAMLQELDAAVGRLLQTLDALGLARNTVVVFTSDNGGVGGYETSGIPGAREITHNAPLRGGKGMLYEGGIRVPLIVRWPAVIHAGSTCSEPVATIDFYPTFLDVTGTPRISAKPLDGASLAALWKSSGAGSLNRDALYWHFPGYLEGRRDGSTWRTTPAAAIRSGNLKLVESFETGRIELYDLAQDIGETRNLADSRPDDAKRLHAALVAWREKINAPMPTPKP